MYFVEKVIASWDILCFFGSLFKVMTLLADHPVAVDAISVTLPQSESLHWYTDALIAS